MIFYDTSGYWKHDKDIYHRNYKFCIRNGKGNYLGFREMKANEKRAPRIINMGGTLICSWVNKISS